MGVRRWRALGFAGGDGRWVLSAHLLGCGGLMLLRGRTADLVGWRRTFLAGTVLFLVSSLLCGVAWTGGVLVGARVLQGVSAALMAPRALSIVTAAFEDGPERHRAIAVWGGVGGFGATAALLVGGPLTEVLGRRSALLGFGLGPSGVAGAVAALAGATDGTRGWRQGSIPPRFSLGGVRGGDRVHGRARG